MRKQDHLYLEVTSQIKMDELIIDTQTRFSTEVVPLPKCKVK